MKEQDDNDRFDEEQEIMPMERAALIDSICWLARYVPRHVLDDVLEDVSNTKLDDAPAKVKDPGPPLSVIECHDQISGSGRATSHPGVTLDALSGEGPGENPTELVDPANTVSKVTASSQPSFLDPFADDDSDIDSLERPQVASFRDPFPYDSDDERDRQERLNNHSGGANSGRFPMTLPYASRHRCALLFVGISGFTELPQILDVENLSKVINTYFEMIVTEVISRGGDILKFSGDAIYVEWPVTSENSSNTHNNNKPSRQKTVCTSLEECTALAAICAASIVTACSKFPVYAPTRARSGEVGVRTKVGELNVTCGIAVGDVSAVHVGDDFLRRKFIIVGDPVNEMSELENATTLGQVAVSPGALAMLNTVFDWDDSITFNCSRKLAIIATRTERFFRIKYGAHFPFLSSSDREGKECLSKQCERFDLRALKRLRQLISLYVHPVVVKDELGMPLRINNTVQERHQAEAELRDVYTISIMPFLTAEVNAYAQMDNELFESLNKILLVVNREVAYYGGQLSKFIMDHKGVTLVANFGLRGSTFPNMVSEHALPCTVAIHNALQLELDIDSQVGATLGKAFCGVVGGSRRPEFVILGPSVNLSASLMSIQNHPGILVDNSVRLKANKDFSFNSLYPVEAIGYADPVLIFEPLSAAEKRWGRPQGDFVGRAHEISAILRMAEDVARGGTHAKMIYIQSESGVGKSALIAQSVSKLRKIANKRVVVTRNISSDGDRMIPFSMFRSIFKNILNELQGPGKPEDPTSRNFSHNSLIDAESISICTGHSSASSAASTRSLDRLAYLVKELDAPPEFLDIVGYHLLGIHERNNATFRKNVKADSLDAIVDFMVLSFLRCTCHANLVVMALDDVHLLDELSWKVVKALFKQGRNLLIVCSSRPLKSYKVEVDPAFWAELHDVYTRELRFSEFYLAGLNKKEVCDLISKKLELPVSEIDSTFSLDLHVKSGGMPHFASQMLEAIKRSNLIAKLENGKVGWRTDMSKEDMPDFNFATVGELTVYRLDSLDANVIRTLHFCAVLGSEFDLSELMVVYQHWIEPVLSENEGHTEGVKRALNVAVQEGILEEIYEGGQEEEKDEVLHGESTHDVGLEFDNAGRGLDGVGNFRQQLKELPLDATICYRFHHDMWRENVLKLMLDTHKRHIHRIIAESLEERASGTDNEKNDYYSMIRLFFHWKASGDTTKAASLALSVGESFINICMNNQAVKMFDEALDMWRNELDGSEVNKSHVAGFPTKVLDSIGTDDLKHIVKLHVAKGKCFLTLLKPKDSLHAYQNALSIMQRTPASADLKDRSITFPVFSGLFILFKLGKIDQDRECSYEQEIVRKFVAETKLHGDPVHYGRALSMQAEVLARLGRVSEALESVEMLAETYDADEHSAAICRAYGSDRCAQVFSLSVLWNLQLGNEERALELVDFVLNDLLPKMDVKNVHNSFLLLWPIYSVLKERGEARRMRMLLEDSVIRPFNEYFGEESFTVMLPLYKPTCMLLELCEDGEVYDLDEKVEWVLQDNAGVFSDSMDNGLGNGGKTCNQVTAEICLCLARRVDDLDTKRKLIAKGTALARLTSKLCSGEYGTAKMPFAYERNKPVHTALELMATEFGVTEEIINNKNYRYQD